MNIINNSGHELCITVQTTVTIDMGMYINSTNSNSNCIKRVLEVFEKKKKLSLSESTNI